MDTGFSSPSTMLPGGYKEEKAKGPVSNHSFPRWEDAGNGAIASHSDGQHRGGEATSSIVGPPLLIPQRVALMDLPHEISGLHLGMPNALLKAPMRLLHIKVG